MSSPISTLRLILDPPAGGAWNMAVDEALLEDAAVQGQATLRFYQWSEPTLSLGYFQKHADRRLHPASFGCHWVRRASGGGAIVHDRELTYSLAVPLAGHFHRPADLYALMHESLLEALARFGIRASLQGGSGCATTDQGESGQAGRLHHNQQPFLCFQRHCNGDVFCGGAKICGSAQRRRASTPTPARSASEGLLHRPTRSVSEALPASAPSALLQHGSVLLARSAAAPELDGLAEISGRAVAPHELVENWLSSLRQRGLHFQPPAPLSGSLRQSAQGFLQAKYEAPAWNQRR